MSYPLRFKRRKGFEQALHAQHVVRAAKNTIPFVVAHLPKWTALMQGETRFHPLFQNEAEVEAIRIGHIPLADLYQLGKVIRPYFHDPWWAYVAHKCPDVPSAERAWRASSLRAYRLLHAVVQGKETNTIRMLVTELESCLHGLPPTRPLSHLAKGSSFC